MNLNSHNTYQDQTVLLDHNAFQDCTFNRCKLQYGGTGPVSITGCRLDNCSWEFVGAAAATIAFLRALYHGFGSGGQVFVESVLSEIRKAG